MATKISCLRVTLVMYALGAPFPAQAQFMTSLPPVIVIPPPTQNYTGVKSTNRSATPDRLKAAVDAPEPAQTPVYQGRSLVR